MRCVSVFGETYPNFLYSFALFNGGYYNVHTTDEVSCNSNHLLGIQRGADRKSVV